MIKSLQDKYKWHSTFVLFPKVVQGKLVWLETVQRRYDEEAGPSVGDFSGYSFATGGWEYKL